jgi:hypothetical protein
MAYQTGITGRDLVLKSAQGNASHNNVWPNTTDDAARNDRPSGRCAAVLPEHRVKPELWGTAIVATVRNVRRKKMTLRDDTAGPLAPGRRRAASIRQKLLNKSEES